MRNSDRFKIRFEPSFLVKNQPSSDYEMLKQDVFNKILYWVYRLMRAS